MAHCPPTVVKPGQRAEMTLQNPVFCDDKVSKILSVHWTGYRTNEYILRELNMKRTL